MTAGVKAEEVVAFIAAHIDQHGPSVEGERAFVNRYNGGGPGVAANDPGPWPSPMRQETTT